MYFSENQYEYRPKEKNIVITGHFGCGKTNVAVNLAEYFRKSGKAVTLADMDIVNPFFRSADNKAELEKEGIKCIIPVFANSNVDIPALPAEMYSLFNDEDKISVLDVGGDDSGAAALGMYSHLLKTKGYEMLYVISKYRPLTATPEEAYALMLEIEERSRLKCTAIINNSNIGSAGSEKDFTDSFEYAEKVSALAGIPVLFDSTFFDIRHTDRKIFSMRNATKKSWEP